MAESSDQKLNDLDHALLIMATFVPFLYVSALNYIFKPTATQLLLVIPFLFIAVALPIYDGYLRPRIEQVQNATADRARAWIYLFFGGGLYAMTLAQYSYIGPPTTISMLLIQLSFIVGLCALAFFSYRFVLWLYRSLRLVPIPIPDKASIVAAMGGTFISALFFEALLALYYGKAINNAPFVYSNSTGEAVTLAFGFAFLAPLLALEVDCHHNTPKVAREYERIREQNPPKPAVKVGKYVWDAMDFVFMSIALASAFLRHQKKAALIVGGLLLIWVGSIVADGQSLLGVSTMFLGDAFIYLFIILRARSQSR
jgi:hypothetical protein